VIYLFFSFFWLLILAVKVLFLPLSLSTFRGKRETVEAYGKIVTWTGEKNSSDYFVFQGYHNNTKFENIKSKHNSFHNYLLETSREVSLVL
jgi:hypothetical protein